MKKTMLVALLLALVLLLTGCAGNEEKLRSRVLLRLNDVTYSYGDLLDLEAETRAYYDQIVAIYAGYGVVYEAATDEQIRDEALNSLAVQAVILDKANQEGLSTLTTAEKRQISANTDAAMANYRAAIRETLTLPEDATEADWEAAVDAAMLENGITRERVYRAEYETFIYEKTRAWAVADVVVTEAEFNAAYNEQLLAEQATMESDPDEYGYYILNGATPLYAPAGYREVDWLLVGYTDADFALLSALEQVHAQMEYSVSDYEATARALVGTDADLDALVAQVTVNLCDVDDPLSITVRDSETHFDPALDADAAAAVQALAEVMALEKAYAQQLELCYAAANEVITPEVEEVMNGLNAGEAWADVQAAHNDDTDMQVGSPVVREDFYYAEPEFVAAAMGIEAPGGYTSVFIEGYGCVVIHYVAEVPAGPVDVELVRESFTAELLSTQQDETFSILMSVWADAAYPYMIINYNLLNK